MHDMTQQRALHTQGHRFYWGDRDCCFTLRSVWLLFIEVVVIDEQKGTQNALLLPHHMHIGV